MARSAVIVLSVVVSLVVVGCTEPRPLPTPTPSISATPEPRGDGVLRIGALFSMDGDLASTGPGMVAAVEIAARDINTAGGVLDSPVEVFYRDSGTAAKTLLETGFAELVARGIDVVIGPADAALAERLVPLADEAGVALVAPAAPVRASTVGSVSLVASAEQHAETIINAIADEGASSVSIITAGDAFGLAFERAARAVLESRELRLAGVEQLDAATNPARLAFSVGGGQPDAVIMASAASSSQNADVISALTDRGIRGDQLWLLGSALADYSASVAEGILEGARGVRFGAPTSDEFVDRLRQSDPSLRNTRFASETYDAVVLSALAAELAGDDSGRSIGSQLRAAAVAGVPCASFGECIDVLTTQPDADYAGLSGPVTVSDSGSVADGPLSVFRYTTENQAELVGPLSVSAP